MIHHNTRSPGEEGPPGIGADGDTGARFRRKIAHNSTPTTVPTTTAPTAATIKRIRISVVPSIASRPIEVLFISNFSRRPSPTMDRPPPLIEEIRGECYQLSSIRYRGQQMAKLILDLPRGRDGLGNLFPQHLAIALSQPVGGHPHRTLAQAQFGGQLGAG